MIVEYKLVREQDQTRAPSWVLDGGYFQNPEDYTMIGTTQNDDVREFYVPDTVVVLSRQQLIDRMLAIHAVNPMRKLNPESPFPEEMTTAEVESLVNAWCDARGEA